MTRMKRCRRWALATFAAAVLCLCVAEVPATSPLDPGHAPALAAKLLGEMRHDTSPERVHELWDWFCRAHFGAEKEPLVYDLFGKELKPVEGGDWVHASETSAVIAWETNLPARTHVEYGWTPACNSRALHAGREPYFYLHVHTLKDLTPDKLHYFRMVSVDERGNRIVSPLMTFTPKAPAGMLHVPGDLPGPPYLLDKPNTTYVLTEDITADGTAIEVAAPNITLDLNGRTVTYHNETIPKETFDDPWMSYVNKGAVGVKNFGQSGFTLVNGVIREGKGNNTGNSESTGFIPVYMRDVGKVRIAGVTVDYWTPQNTGMRFRGAGDDVEVHHCVFLDRGCVIRNRHGAAVRSLSFLGQKGTHYRVHHNLVKRTRQMGILGPNQLNHNEIYVDSWSVNSFAMAPWKDEGEAHHNRIFGTGVNVQGFGWGTQNVHIHHNLIHLAGIDTGSRRNKEGWGDQDSMNGLRVTNYDKGGQVRDNLLYHDNLVVITNRGGSQARGTEFFSDDTITDLVCRDTTFKVEALDDKTSQIACVVTHGQPAKADTCLPVWYRDCTLISNLCNVRFSDYYGKGSNHHFVRCRIVRTGNDERYHTFIVDGAYWSKRHVLLDCVFEGGAAYNDVLWKITSAKSFYSVKWTLTVKTLPGAKVAITDKEGQVEFEGKADATGKVDVPLTQCVVRPPAKLKCPSTERVEDVKTPHAVTATLGAWTKTATVEMTEKHEITVRP